MIDTANVYGKLTFYSIQFIEKLIGVIKDNEKLCKINDVST